MFGFGKNFSPIWTARQPCAKLSDVRTRRKNMSPSFIDYDTMSSATSSLDSLDSFFLKPIASYQRHSMLRKADESDIGPSGAIAIPRSRNHEDAEKCIKQECLQKAWAMHFRLTKQKGTILVSPADEEALADMMLKYNDHIQDLAQDAILPEADREDMLFKLDL
jgi:hypothetical protein